MPYFFGKYKKIDDYQFRFDARVYLREKTVPLETDNCLGLIVMMNPPKESGRVLIQNSEWSNINDKQTSGVLSRLHYLLSKTLLERVLDKSYVQIYNLIDLCDNNFESAIEIWDNKNFCISNRPSNDFNFVWYAWGFSNKRYNELKSDVKFKSGKHFFFDQQYERIREGVPARTVHAMHLSHLIKSDLCKVNTPTNKIAEYLKTLI